MDHLPQQWTDFVSYQAVEYAPCLLRVYLFDIKLFRVLDGIAHRPRRNLVEENTSEFTFFLGNLLTHVPSYGFAFAIGVRRQVNGFYAFGCFA